MPEIQAQFQAKLRRHRHNSFLGHVGMCKANMIAIIHSDTTTPEAKAIASKILDLALMLGPTLRKRVDPKPKATQ